MKKVFITGLLLLMSVQVLAATELPRDPVKHFFEQTLGDLTEDLQDAKDANKKGVLIFFEQEECPFCHRMKTTVLNQVRVQKYFLDRFLVISMDIESDGEITDFEGNSTTMKKYFAKVARNRGATPVFAFFDMQGKLVVRYTGASSGIDEFMWLGEYASEGHYKDMTFSKYKRIKRKQQREAR